MRSKATVSGPVIALLVFLALLPRSATMAVQTNYAFTRVPSNFKTTELSVGSNSLGNICLSRDRMPDGTVCNSAFLSETSETFLAGRFFASNGYTAYNRARELIYEPISKETLRNLFQEKNVTSIDANLDLRFQTKNFAASFAPYRVQYVSEIHNPNLPVLALHASVERRFTFASGFSLKQLSPNLENLSVGARARFVEREYVHNSFSIFDLAVKDTDEIISVKKQYGLFLDPSIGYVHRPSPWSPRASVMVRNIGKAWPEDPLYDETTDLDLGIGLDPPIGFGQWRVGFDLVDLIHGASIDSRLRVGTSYSIGMTEIMLGRSSDYLSAGLQFGFQNFMTGISYDFIELSKGAKKFEKRVSTELSVVF